MQKRARTSHLPLHYGEVFSALDGVGYAVGGPASIAIRGGVRSTSYLMYVSNELDLFAPITSADAIDARLRTLGYVPVGEPWEAQTAEDDGEFGSSRYVLAQQGQENLQTIDVDYTFSTDRFLSCDKVKVGSVILMIMGTSEVEKALQHVANTPSFIWQELPAAERQEVEARLQWHAWMAGEAYELSTAAGSVSPDAAALE